MQEVTSLDRFYQLNNPVMAVAHHKMHTDTVKTLWDRFTLGETAIKFLPCEEFLFKIGEPRVPVLEGNREYALCVDENGCAVVGKDFGGLMRGFFVLLMNLEPHEGEYILRHTCRHSEYLLENRMIHICVFPENNLYLWLSALISRPQDIVIVQQRLASGQKWHHGIACD